MLTTLPETLVKDRAEFVPLLDAAVKKAGAQARRPRSGGPSSTPSANATKRPPSAGTRTATPSPTPTSATPRTCRSARDVRGVLRAGGQAACPRRLGRTTKPRREGRRGRPRRLRDQLQPLLLPLHAAAAAGGNRGRYSENENDIVRMLSEVTGSAIRAAVDRHDPQPHVAATVRLEGDGGAVGDHAMPLSSLGSFVRLTTSIRRRSSRRSRGCRRVRLERDLRAVGRPHRVRLVGCVSVSVLIAAVGRHDVDLPTGVVAAQAVEDDLPTVRLTAGRESCPSASVSRIGCRPRASDVDVADVAVEVALEGDARPVARPRRRRSRPPAATWSRSAAPVPSGSMV